MTRPAAMAAALAAVALAGCGGGSDATAPGGPVSPGRAAAEASATKLGLDTALDRYRGGDRGAASDTLAAVRGEHFALVEPALRQVDAPLATSLHRALFADLPHLIDQGVTVTQLARRMVAVEVGLDTARSRLRAP